MNRREFLKLIGSTGLGIIASQTPLGRIIPLCLAKDAPLPKEEEDFIKTACLLCPAGCGIEARVRNGIVISVRGNKLHPISRGGLCAKGLLSPHFLYHPDRIKSPLKRKGERGSTHFVEIKIEDALNEIAERIKNLISRGKSKEIYFINGRPYGLMDKLIEKFMNFLNSDSIIKEDIFYGIKRVIEDIHGKSLFPVFDIANSNYVLSIGSDLFDGSYNPVGFAKAFSYFRQKREGKRGIFVHVEPRYSLTSSKADRWIKIKPNSYYEFLLGIHYVIIKEKLYEEKFIEEFVDGFEDFKDFIEKNIHIQDIERRTGVSGGYIYLIAREFVQNKPSVCIPGFHLISEERYFETLYLAYVLNIITGNIEKDGGVKFPYKLPYKKIKGTFEEYAFKNNIDFKSENKPEILFLYHSNPLYKGGEKKEIREFLNKTGLIISFSPFLDETAKYADYIIPDHTFLEKWQDAPCLTTSEEIACALVKPVITPLFNTIHTGDFLIRLAKRIDIKGEEEFPYKNFKEFLFEGLKGFYEAQTGSFFEPEFESKQLKIMEESGFWLPPYKDLDGFYDKLIEKGGWFDPAYIKEEWKRIIKNKKFVLRNKYLKKIRDKEEEIYLYVYKPLTISYGTDSIFPYSHEIVGFHSDVMYDSFCELSQELAKKLNLKDGEIIEIESEFGKIKTKVKIVEKGEESIISFPLSLGHSEFGRFTRGIGENPLKILKPIENLNIIKVKIRRI